MDKKYRDRYLPLTLEKMEAGEAPELDDQMPKRSVYRFSVASEEPVNMGGFREILSHANGAIDLSRLPGMVFLWQHGHDKIGKQPLGKVENWQVQSRKSYVDIRPTLEEYALPFWRQVDDGILTDVSIRYEVISDRQIDNNTILVDQWVPVHATLCADPADHTVGFNRSLDESYKSTVEINEYPAGGKMEDQVIDREKIKADESLRQREIRAAGENFAKLFDNPKFREFAENFIDTDKSILEARSLFSKEIEKLPASRAIASAPYDQEVGLSKKEKAAYSIRTAIRSQIQGFPEFGANCLEREVSSAISQRLGRPSQGLFIPISDLDVSAIRSRDFNVTNAAQGGNLVATELMPSKMIEILQQKVMAIAMGAQFFTGLTGNLDMPVETTDMDAYWLDGENSSIPETDAEFGLKGLRMKTVAALTAVTRDMLIQSSIDIENRIKTRLINKVAQAIDKAIISGTGLNGQPKGILNRVDEGVNLISLGTNGAALTYANIVNFPKLIQTDNAELSAMQWLGNPHVTAKLRTTPKQASGVEGNFILSESAADLMGYKYNWTNFMPSDLTKASGSALSALIFGCWDQVMIGEWGTLEVVTNPYGRGWKNGSIEVRLLKSCDTQIEHPEAFTICKDIVTT